MHIIQLLISMSVVFSIVQVKLIEGNYMNFLFVAGGHEVTSFTLYTAS